MRRIKLTIAFLLACILCLSYGTAFAVEIGEEITLQNSGFEEGLSGWSIMDEEQAMADTEDPYEGEQCLKITNTKGTNPWIAQYFKPPQARAMYTISCWMKADLHNPEVGAGFKIEQYDSENNYLGAGADNDRLFINTNNTWVPFEMTFQSIDDVARIKIYARCYSEGTVWYDNITVKLSGGPEPYSCYMDHVFHYPDEETGSVTISLDTFYEANGKEATDVSASFTFLDKDGETVLDKKENVPIVNHEAVYTYPVSLMKEKKAQYKLHAEVRDKKTGAVVREWTENKYVYDRPEWMPENGKFIIDGEPFYPIIGYHVGHDEFDDLYANGKPVINTAQLGVGCAADDAQHELVFNEFEKYPELRGFYSLYPYHEPAAHPKNIEQTKRRVEQLKDHPQIIGWIVMDEPLGGDEEFIEERKVLLEESYRVIREIDPKRPVYLLENGNEHKITIRYCDVFVADVYQRGESARDVSRIIEPLTEKHPRLSTYELACTFESLDVFPPVRTIRASVYRGLEAGGSYGTGFYAVQNAIGHDKEDEDKGLYLLDEWEPITAICQEELPILFAHYGGDGDITFNTYREGALYEEHLWETWFDKNGDMYLLAHNRDYDTAEFNIPLVSKNGKIRVGAYKAEPIGITETGEKTGNGSMTLTLEQEQIALYKIIPEEKVDLSQLDAPMFDDLSGDYAWAAEAVTKTQALGIINGKGEGIFAPAEAISRGDFAGFLIRTLGFTSESTENFADVPAEREYAKEIAAGKALGILNGVGENIFSPEEAITRQDMMTIAARGMKMAGKLAAADASVLDGFHDKANVADYALESVSAMIASGIIRGDDAGYLNPTGNTRRAEAAVIMERILNAKTVAQAPEGTPDAPKVENETVEFDAPSEAALARYNRAIDLLKGLGTPEIKAEASLTNAEAEAILSAVLGYAYDGFGENHKALTTAAATEAFVKLLGYEAYTQRDGGFMGVASRLDLLKGVDIAQEYLRGGEFAVMLENALGIYLADPAGYGGDAEGMYVESTDTLLTRYRHLTLYKGILEQNENTGLPKGQVAVGTNLLEVGETDAKSFIGQRVEAYAEGEDNTIVYIRAHKNVTVTTVRADKIDRGETDMTKFVFENEEGHTKSVNLSAPKVIYNGDYKTNADVNTLLPKSGSVTLIENTGAGADYVLVEKYNNYIVENTYAEDMQIFFKNRDVLIWDEADRGKRLSMEGGTLANLKEWNVISLLESEDGKVLHAVVSGETVKGKVTELSEDDIRIDDALYPLSEAVFGTYALGEEYTFLLDAAGFIAGVNDDAPTSNYVYFTTVFKNKGMDGTVQLRVFTPKGEMKVLDVKETVTYNGTPIPAAELVNKTELIENNVPKGQLIVMETAKDGEKEIVTAMETAVDGKKLSNTERWSVFSLDEEIGNAETDAANYTTKRIYEGYDQVCIGSKYFVEPDTVYFRVPVAYSQDVSAYSVVDISSLEHGDKFEDTRLYDVSADQEVAVIVQTLKDSNIIGADGQPGVVKSIGQALTEDGDTVLSITLQGVKEETFYFTKNDHPILLKGAITSIAKGEPKHTGNTIDEYILPKDLEIGDVVQYQTMQTNPKAISTMRVLCRRNYAVNMEASAKNDLREFYNYSALTYAYGTIDRIINRGFMMTPGKWERVFVLDYKTKLASKGVVLVEGDTIKVIPEESVRVGDSVYVQKSNAWQVLTVVYR